MRNLKNYLLLLLLAGILPLGNVFGQFEDDAEENKRPKVSGGWGYFTAGFQNVDMAPLNTALGDLNLPAFDDNSMTVGGGGYLVISNFLIGGEGHSISNMMVGTADREARVGGGWGAFNIGYTPIATNGGLIITPRLGIGGYNFQLFVKDGAAPSDFGGVVSDPGTASQLEKRGLVLTADLGVNYSIAYKEGRGGGIFVGMDVGYCYVPRTDSWTLHGTEISGGPNLNMTGMFVRVKIGGAGWHRQ